MTFGKSVSADGDKAVILKSNVYLDLQKLYTHLPVSLGINSSFLMRPHSD